MKKQNTIVSPPNKMHVFPWIITAVLLTCFAGNITAQEAATTSVVMKEQTDIRVKVTGKDSAEVRTPIEKSSDDRPMLGVYMDDLDFETAYKMHYDYTYGVLVDGVVSDGAAERAGIMEKDIIMEFDGEKVRHEDHMVRLIQSKQVGESIPMKFFRDGNVNTVSVVLQGRNGKKAPTKKKERHIDAGDGGLTFYATWYQPDHQAISDLLNRSGFTDVLTDLPFGDGNEKALLMRGFQFQFESDNNWFWGFDFNDYEISRRSSGNTDRRMKYDFGYWGFKMQKRVPVFNFLLLDGGFTAGKASYNIKLYEVSQSYNWNTLNSDMNSADNNYVELEKKYLMAHPNASIILRFTDWIGVRGNVGYMLGYSYHSRWNAKVVNDDLEVSNSPETTLNGVTYSVGLWFDFF